MHLICLVSDDIPEKSFTAKDAHQLQIWVKLHVIDVQQSNHIIVLGFISLFSKVGQLHVHLSNMYPIEVWLINQVVTWSFRKVGAIHP